MPILQNIKSCYISMEEVLPKFLQDFAQNEKPFFKKGFKLFIISNFNLSVSLLVIVVCNDISIHCSVFKL